MKPASTSRLQISTLTIGNEVLTPTGALLLAYSCGRSFTNPTRQSKHAQAPVRQILLTHPHPAGHAGWNPWRTTSELHQRANALFQRSLDIQHRMDLHEATPMSEVTLGIVCISCLIALLAADRIALGQGRGRL
jgi:hypothetical protein